MPQAATDRTRPQSGSARNQVDRDLLVRLLLNWFDQAGRCLPWRQSKDPYRVWISEIMLQQTQVQTVIPYYERFLGQYPTVQDLAAADDAAVLKSWEGLGYYSRARHLLQAARTVVSRFGGQMPDDPVRLRQLPGIGDYTAGAIASIATGKSVPAVDGNAVRVFARLTGTPWTAGDPADRRAVTDQVATLLPADRPGDFNEAVMDLGATVCLPRDPNCTACPLAQLCIAFRQGQAGRYPLKKTKRAVPSEWHVVLILHRQNRWHVVRRPDRGLLAGLYTFDWLADTAGLSSAADREDSLRKRIGMLQQKMGVTMSRLPPHNHRFTHLLWQLDAFLIELDGPDLSLLDGLLVQGAVAERTAGEDHPASLWVSDRQLADLPFPAAIDHYRRLVLESTQMQRDLEPEK